MDILAVESEASVAGSGR